MTLPKHFDQVSPRETILEMATAHIGFARCIFVAAKLGIADLLKEGQKHTDELANATHTHSDSLYRLLRTLASRGIFAEVQAKYFQLTPLSVCLQENHPSSVRDFIILTGGSESYACWENLIHSVYTGKNAFESVYGMEYYQYLEQNPAVGELFDRAMTNLSRMQNVAIPTAYDFSSLGRVIDISGGQGGLLAAILKQYPTVTGVLFDRAETIDKSHDLLKTEGVIDRCERVAGDFFESVPTGGDAYLLKNVVHNWDDEKALKILQNCHQAMTEGKRLLLIEKILDPLNSSWRELVGDMKMLATNGGRTRTEDEFRKLFEAASFKLTQIVPTASGLTVMEGVSLKQPH
ncbi:methyltransferase [Deltaproteobacteria bacterium TL4]